LQVVILSGVETSLGEVPTQSKDPYLPAMTLRSEGPFDSADPFASERIGCAQDDTGFIASEANKVQMCL